MVFKAENALIGINTDIAREYGVQAAAIYNHVGHLNAKGECATVDTVMDDFSFLTKNQIKHSLRVLEGAGVLEATQPNRSKMDATKHYFAGVVG